MAVEVRVEGLLGSLQNQMAIRAIVHVVGNGCGDAGRETSLQVLTNQSNSLSAGHASPLKYLPPWITEHELLQLYPQAHASIEPLKSTIYEKMSNVLGPQKSNREGNFFTDESHFGMVSLVLKSAMRLG
jgi:hypothetical protein